ncbi:hypothetical protein AKJ16_DCAP01640 [Drosera capensis]
MAYLASLVWLINRLNLGVGILDLFSMLKKFPSKLCYPREIVGGDDRSLSGRHNLLTGLCSAACLLYVVLTGA